MTSSAHVRFDIQLSDSITYLESVEAQRSFDEDAYWPKWNSPWWHMTLMWELGAASRIPQIALQRLLTALKARYVHFFPFSEAEVPPGVDPISGVMCHCGLGTAYQILRAAGVDVDLELPWVRKWIIQYQISDGGWNCDESAYTKGKPKSSVVSSLLMLESLLSIEDRSEKETEALDAGADYLVRRHLIRSTTTGAIINHDWLKLTFPRFYGYDILRGLSFCANWAEQRGKPLPAALIDEATGTVQAKIIAREGKTGLPVERQFYKSCDTRIKITDGSWTKAPISDFPLLLWSSQIGQISPSLTDAWSDVVDTLKNIQRV